jgi:hypothetical protein
MTGALGEIVERCGILKNSGHIRAEQRWLELTPGFCKSRGEQFAGALLAWGQGRVSNERGANGVACASGTEGSPEFKLWASVGCLVPTMSEGDTAGNRGSRGPELNVFGAKQGAGKDGEKDEEEDREAEEGGNSGRNVVDEYSGPLVVLCWVASKYSTGLRSVMFSTMTGSNAVELFLGRAIKSPPSLLAGNRRGVRPSPRTITTLI